MRTVMKPLVTVVVVLVALAPIGCAHRKAVATPDPKPDVGTVALVVATDAQTPYFQRPGAVGASEGAKQGAKRGAVAPFIPGAAFTAGAAQAGSGAGVVYGVMLLAAGAALAPVGAGIGAAVGAIVVPSADEVERAAAALEHAFGEAGLSKTLAAWMVDAAGERPMLLDDAGGNANTRLDVDAPNVALTSKDPSDWSPALRLRVTLNARLIRVSDGEQLRTFSWEHEGPKATFLRWGKDDARLFRAELERAGRALAAKVVADLY